MTHRHTGHIHSDRKDTVDQHADASQSTGGGVEEAECENRQFSRAQLGDYEDLAEIFWTGPSKATGTSLVFNGVVAALRLRLFGPSLLRADGGK